MSSYYLFSPCIHIVNNTEEGKKTLKNGTKNPNIQIGDDTNEVDCQKKLMNTNMILQSKQKKLTI